VIFGDGASFAATVVGANDFCDLALLKIDRTG
jgi:S1-C subfamily serine protease